jgi:hypothetical protein
VPPLQQALDAVRAELYGSRFTEAMTGSDPALSSDGLTE